MTYTTRLTNDNVSEGILYMAMELSQSKWRLAFGAGSQRRQVVIEAGDRLALNSEIGKAKAKFKLKENAEVISCYEAGRDGFWIHRHLEKVGIKNHVVDSSSIDVNRKKRRAKTDRLDADKLLKKLIFYIRGDEKLSVARVPSEEAEDRRRIHREREALKKECTRHKNRIKSLMILQGIKFSNKGKKGWRSYVEGLRDWKNELFPRHQQAELFRIVERLEMAEKQLKGVEKQMQEALATSEEPVYEKIKQLKELKGLGDIGSWTIIMEWLGWRKFSNRREVGSAAGLVGSPYDSGDSRREQGITKAGNGRIRTLMIQLAWGWLRHQPNSQLSQWFKERFEQGGRLRKVGIVALARKLLIALWRYVTQGVLPEGAELKTPLGKC
jgi:transposase